MTHAQGQSVVDRLTAAKHSIAGHGLAKSVCKATTEEVMGPKKKHIDYLVACTNEPNVSIPQLANLLIERTVHQNWVIVFKSLITVHNLMNYGNERFTQYLASNNCTFNLSGYKDKTTSGDVTGYDMSTFIRRYSKYLNDKAYSYRSMAFDFCKVKRGKDDGLLRTMNAEKLLKTLPVLQQQVDGLLEFDCTPNELTNGVINAAFMLMFKDLIRLFACYNDGIINLLEKYFEMNKKQCREALDIYKKFLTRMDKVSEFLKTAENVGIDKGDIPDLAKAPSSLLEALEEHLKSLEGSKKAGPPAVKPAPPSVTSAINSLSGTPDPSSLSEEEKKRILEEEQRTLNDLKERREKSTNPFAMSPTEAKSPTSGGVGDLLGGAGSPTTTAGGSDLLSLAATNPFAASGLQNGSSPWAPPATAAAPPPVAAAPVQNGGSPWGPPATANPTASMNGTGFGADANFAAAFGDSTAPPATQTGVSPLLASSVPLVPTVTSTVDSTPPGFDGFGQVMQPAGNVGAAPTGPMPGKKAEKLISGDLDSSLMSLVGNLNINPSSQQIKKTDHKWKPSAHGGAPMGSAGTAPSGWAAQPMSGSTFPPAGAPPAPSYQAAVPNNMSSMPVNHVAVGMSGVPVMGMQQQQQPPVMMMNATMQPPQQQPITMMNAQPQYMNQQPQGGGMGMGMGQQPMMGGYQQPMGMVGQPRPMGMPAQQQPMFGAPQQQQGAMFGQQQQPQQPNDPFGNL